MLELATSVGVLAVSNSTFWIDVLFDGIAYPLTRIVPETVAPDAGVSKATVGPGTGDGQATSCFAMVVLYKPSGVPFGLVV